MGSEWTDVALGDLFNVKHGFAFKGEYFTENPTEALLVTPGNFAIGGGFQNSKPKYYNGPIPDDYVLSPGQIVVTMTDLSKQSDTLGFAAIVPDDGNMWLHNQRVGLLEFKENYPSDPRFIGYLLRAHAYRSWVIGSATGTTVKHTSPSRIHSFTCSIPPIDDQKLIANILGSLDDKIELNCQMNATLESMAQALFKSWFLDFDPVIDNALVAGNPIPEPLHARVETRKALAEKRKPLPEAIQKQFPSRFVFNEVMEWVPEGWEVRPLGEVVSTIIDHRGKTPKKLGSDWSDKGYPAISAKNIKNGRIVRADTIRFVDDVLYSQWMKVPLEQGDIALTSEAPLGEMYYFATKTDYLLSQRLYGLRAKKEMLSGGFLYQWMQTEKAQSDLESRATGTTVVGIRQSELQKIAVLCPSVGIALEYAAIADGQLLSIDSNERETDSLRRIRDSLLPKLLSGQLRIPDVEKQVADAV